MHYDHIRGLKEPSRASLYCDALLDIFKVLFVLFVVHLSHQSSGEQWSWCQDSGKKVFDKQVDLLLVLIGIEWRGVKAVVWNFTPHEWLDFGAWWPVTRETFGGPATAATVDYRHYSPLAAGYKSFTLVTQLWHTMHTKKYICCTFDLFHLRNV